MIRIALQTHKGRNMASELTTVEFQHALVLQAWQCLIGDGRITYVSGPITTGLRWIEALESGSNPDGPVINANCDTIRRAARKLRRETRELVLEPASLHVESWSQDDYLALWTTLIERHAAAVAFVEDWPYSIGCALEFERAVTHKVVARTLEGEPISRADGTALIRQAAEDVMARSATASRAATLAERLAAVALRLETTGRGDAQQIGIRAASRPKRAASSPSPRSGG
ncbi:MAG TPA: hypothetical protein VF680_16205 [Allosphingosinicella sp.]|jgi:hypothetical protein